VDCLPEEKIARAEAMDLFGPGLKKGPELAHELLLSAFDYATDKSEDLFGNETLSYKFFIYILNNCLQISELFGVACPCYQLKACDSCKIHSGEFAVIPCWTFLCATCVATSTKKCPLHKCDVEIIVNLSNL